MCGAYSEDPETMWKIDSLIDGWNDLLGALQGTFKMATEEEKNAKFAEIRDGPIKNYLKIINDRYVSGMYIA